MTTIFLGPSGSGKSTRIDVLKRTGLDFVHINRDHIYTLLINDYQRYSGLVTDPKRRELLIAIEILRDGIYLTQLTTEIEKGIAHLIIDCPPGSKGVGWAVEAATLRKKAGRLVVLEGISASPEITLPRVLRRNSMGMDLLLQIPEIMQHDRNKFKKWLHSYIYLPSQFIEISNVADLVFLHDNNGDVMRLIGEWNTETYILTDEVALHQFFRLADIDTNTARFEARPIKSERAAHGELVHTFEVITSGFYSSIESWHNSHHSLCQEDPRLWKKLHGSTSLPQCVTKPLTGFKSK